MAVIKIDIPETGNPQDGELFRFPTAQGRDFNITHSAHANGFGETQTNDVVRMGWNIAYSGGREINTEHAFALEFERFWAQNEEQRWAEFHLAYIHPPASGEFPTRDGGLRRCWSVLMDTEVNNTCTQYWQALSYEWRDFTISPGNAWMILAGTGLTMAVPIYLENEVPVYGRSEDAASQIPMVQASADDRVRLGSTAFGIEVPGAALFGDPLTGPTDADVTLYSSVTSAEGAKHLLEFQNTAGAPAAPIGMRWAGPDANSRARLLGDSEYLYWDTSADGGATYTPRATLQRDFVLHTASRGFVCTSPDGTVTRRLGIDNSGALSITTV